jgi:hypothetical protein
MPKPTIYRVRSELKGDESGKAWRETDLAAADEDEAKFVAETMNRELADEPDQVYDIVSCEEL